MQNSPVTPGPSTRWRACGLSFLTCRRVHRPPRQLLRHGSAFAAGHSGRFAGQDARRRTCPSTPCCLGPRCSRWPKEARQRRFGWRRNTQCGYARARISSATDQGQNHCDGGKMFPSDSDGVLMEAQRQLLRLRRIHSQTYRWSRHSPDDLSASPT